MPGSSNFASLSSSIFRSQYPVFKVRRARRARGSQLRAGNYYTRLPRPRGRESGSSRFLHISARGDASPALSSAISIDFRLQDDSNPQRVAAARHKAAVVGARATQTPTIGSGCRPRCDPRNCRMTPVDPASVSGAAILDPGRDASVPPRQHPQPPDRCADGLFMSDGQVKKPARSCRQTPLRPWRNPAAARTIGHRSSRRQRHLAATRCRWGTAVSCPPSGEATPRRHPPGARGGEGEDRPDTDWQATISRPDLSPTAVDWPARSNYLRRASNGRRSHGVLKPTPLRWPGPSGLSPHSIKQTAKGMANCRKRAAPTPLPLLQRTRD